MCRVTIQCKDELLNVCVDSGATLSLLSRVAYDRIERTGSVTPLKPVKQTVKGASGSQLRVDGWATIRFTIEGYPYTGQVLVGELSGVDMLLGMDWLTQVRARIDFNAMIAELRHDQVVRLRTTDEMHTNAPSYYVANQGEETCLYPGAIDGCVKLAFAHTLPPGKVMMVHCLYTGSWLPGDTLCFEPTLELKDGMRVLDCIQRIDHAGRIDIAISNANPYDINPPKDLLVGRVDALPLVGDVLESEETAFKGTVPTWSTLPVNSADGPAQECQNAHLRLARGDAPSLSQLALGEEISHDPVSYTHLRAHET